MSGAPYSAIGGASGASSVASDSSVDPSVSAV